MFCTACATPNALAARSCRGCGLGLRREPERRNNRDAVPRIGARRRRLAAPVLLGLPALVLLLGGWASYRTAWAEPAAWYDRAVVAEAAGRYPDALAAYAAAAGHRDAELRRDAVAAAFAPHRAAYESALEATAAGRHDEAIALLLPAVRALPGYEDAARLLGDARRLRAADLARRADDAEARRDWPAAERALTELAAADPGDDAVADRLAALQRGHSPLVLARDRALWLVGPDGADERLLTDAVPAAWPAWSPDRARVAFTSPEDGGGIALYVVAADGSGLTRLADGLRPYAGPVWSPDGARIAFAAEGGWTAGTGEIEPEPPGIRVVEVASGRVVDVTAGRVREPLYPTWSPTGDRLAFVSRNPEDGFGAETVLLPTGSVLPAGEVYVATLASGEVANVSAGRVPHPWRVAWSPADDRIMVYTREPGMSYDRDRARVALVDAGSGEVVDLPTEGERITMPVWSPDGTRVAYVAGEQNVVVRDLDGPVSRVDLDAVISRFLAWSPDGGALIAVAENAERASFLLAVDDPAARPTSLRLDHDTDRRHAGAPQWSPPRPAVLPASPTVGGTALDHDED